ncbi:MAG: hypothetical protein WC538_22630 [Thermoanaerobaculia bacterium]|jgi:hypothetical protein
MLKDRIGSLAFAAAILLLIPVPVYAYLDPANGSILLQVILGGVAGGAVAIRLFWGRIRAFFGAPSAPVSRDDKPSV